MTESLEFGRSVLEQEAEGIRLCAGILDEHFERAVQSIVSCTGYVAVSGVGKPWLIAQKISATMASTGTPSFALHPSDALHGDLGRLQSSDIVLVLSNSGTSDEIVSLLPAVTRLGCPIFAVTSRPESPLGEAADLVLNMGDVQEACPIGMAPSVSTTVMLALGDALSLAVMKARSFGREDYARFHPAGALGRSLMRVDEVMHPLDATAVVPLDATVKDALKVITEHKTGAAFVTSEGGRLAGVFTDGDLRRHVEDDHLLSQEIGKVMTADPICTAPTALVTEAVYLMQQHREKRIGEIPVVDAQNVLVGHIALKDLVAMHFV